MPFEKVEFDFPDEGEDSVEIEVEGSSALEMDNKDSQKPAPAKEKAKDKGEDSLEIEVVDDVPKEDRGRKPSTPPEDVTDDELENYSEKVRQRIKHFSKGYHDERREKEQAFREREELERYARKLSEENNNLKGTVGKNQATLLEQAKRAIAGDLAAAKKAYKDAYEAGDSDALVLAQEQMNTAAIKADRVNNFKLPPLQPAETDVKQQVEPQQPRKDDPKAAHWAADNPWFGSNDEMTSFALGLHTKLMKEGVDPKSDDYYGKINARMRKLFPEEFDVLEEEESAPPPRQKSNVVAPASRSVAPRKVRLTQTQVSLAKRLGVPLEVYARQVAEDMRKEQ